MKIINGIRHLDSSISGSILTIGNFDGVHLGHQVLLHRLVSRAREAKLPAVVMTFEPHPVKVLHPDRRMPRIFDLEDQKKKMRDAGVDLLVVEPFSREFSQVPPDRFIGEWIYRELSPKCVVVGYDFSFGANRGGSIEFLKDKAKALGFEVEVVPPFKVMASNGSEVLVSSTRVRQAVEDGDVELARALLGREFYLGGLVGKGAGRGRTIGIPTANLSTSAELLPKRGVYAAWAYVAGAKQKAVVNIGLNPTFVSGAHTLSIEAHLLDFAQDIYGEYLKLEFVGRLRDEMKFNSAAELVAQIHTDIAKGVEVLNAGS